jgi:predicted anti-sigma-YlaC factor YlaD
MVRRSQECERVRASISVALDGELSEFESMHLSAHLQDCATCREFEASAQISTAALRSAPLEPLSRPVAVPSRRRLTLPVRVPTAAAAAAVLMVAFGGVFESLHGGAAIRGSGSQPSANAFDSRLDSRAITKRQQQANLNELLVRRALYQSNLIARHPGFQTP